MVTQKLTSTSRRNPHGLVDDSQRRILQLVSTLSRGYPPFGKTALERRSSAASLKQAQVGCSYARDLYEDLPKAIFPNPVNNTFGRDAYRHRGPDISSALSRAPARQSTSPPSAARCPSRRQETLQPSPNSTTRCSQSYTIIGLPKPLAAWLAGLAPSRRVYK